ncbi:MAG TPA: isocitrate lyase/PEP mutase family protein [Hyphomicrobiaceae bacterium]|nr:isocitrate lyase/PEP mutase family protein [Hyphomicrobiaceae bacterium]
MSKATALSRLIAAGPIVVAPGAPDALTARLVERAGFPAVYMTGFGATASRLGMPDIGLMSQTEMTGHARDMVRATSLPVIADADTGYGGPSNIERTIEEYVAAGVAAVHLEDQVAPKRCGQMAGIRLIDAAENARRLRCALAARGTAERLLVIARTDALPATGLDEAVRRAALYRDAGADLLFVDGVKTRAEVEGIARRVAGPKVVSLVDGTDAALLTTRELQDMGFAVVLYAVAALFTAARAVEAALAAIKVSGSLAGIAGKTMSYAEFTEVVRLSHHQGLDDRYGS